MLKSCQSASEADRIATGVKKIMSACRSISSQPYQPKGYQIQGTHEFLGCLKCEMLFQQLSSSQITASKS